MRKPPLHLDLVEHSYDRQSWHGATLRGAIRGLTPMQACWRPAPDRHNIHEIVVHAAYWKYAVCRRLTGSRRGAFARPGSNWFRADEKDLPSWKSSVELLSRCHEALRSAVAHFPEERLFRTAPGGTVNYWRLISGIAMHDVYHAGQVQLLKKLQHGGLREARRG